MDAVPDSDHQNMTSDLDPLLGTDSFIEPNTDSIDLTEPQPEPQHEPQPEPETPIQPPPSISSNGGSDSQPMLRGRRVRSGAELSSDEQWLPASWSVEDRVRTSGASAGHVDKYYVDPVSGKRFRSKKEVLQYLETGVLTKKKKTADNLDSNTKLTESSKSPNKKAKGAAKFDFLKVPESVEWVLTDANSDTWTPFLGPKKVSDTEKRQWAAAFTSVTTKGYGNRL